MDIMYIINGHNAYITQNSLNQLNTHILKEETKDMRSTIANTLICSLTNTPTWSCCSKKQVGVTSV